MSNPWDVLAVELKDVLTKQGDAFVSIVTESYEEFAKELGKEYAEQLYRAKKADTVADRKEAQDNMEIILLTLASRLAGTQLDFLSEGRSALEKALKMAGKVALAVATGL